MTTWRSLTRDEALHRRSLLDVHQYDVSLDLTSDDSFASTTVIAFESGSGDTFLDLKARTVHDVLLDGSPVPAADLASGRVPLALTPGSHELRVVATMGYRTDGEGLHRSVDPVDGRSYLYGMSFMDAAPSIFACFDQPDLKAPYTFTITAPADWLVRGNAPAAMSGEDTATRTWSIGPTPPLSTYFVTVVAGPYHLIEDQHDGIGLSLSARRSLIAPLERDADELLTITKQSFDELHRLFEVRYPFGDYHQAFVPEFNAGAMENPGCVTIRDNLLFERTSTRPERSQRAALVAHEMAHQWFGNLVTPRWWDDLWLNESFAEYTGYRVIADATDYSDAWQHQSYSRRVWGLEADRRPTTHPVAGNAAPDAVTALQSFDGISYARGCNVLRQLATRYGDDVFLAGVRDHFARHRFGNATMHDLFASWERAGARELDEFVRDWLLTPGPDLLRLDRAAGVVRREAPPEHPADRTHLVDVARHDGARWHVARLTIDGAVTPYDASDAPLLIDVNETTWAVSPPDPLTLAALPRLAPDLPDAQWRAAMWNNLRLGLGAGAISPQALAEILVASPPVEDTSSGIRNLVLWVLESALPVLPSGTAERLHDVVLARVSSEPDPEVRLSALRYAIGTASDADLLARWAAGELPAGIPPDDDLRWRTHTRQAELGLVARAELDEALAANDTAGNRVAHTRAVASLPTAEAKEFAWHRLTGEADVPNYEIEAAGLGMWRPGQLALTAPYAQRYFGELPLIIQQHQGWMQATVVAAFFPSSHLDATTVASARAALDGDLPGAVHRKLADQADELQRRVAVRRALEVVSGDPV